MQLVRFRTPTEFYEQAQIFLLKREAAHNLIIGLARNLIDEPGLTDKPYMALVYDDDRIVGAALRTPPHNVVLSYVVSAEALRLLARDLHAVYRTLPGVLAPTGTSQSFVNAWHEITGENHQLASAQRVYQLERVNPVQGVPGHLRPAIRQDRDLLLDWLTDFYQEAAPHSLSQKRMRANVDLALETDMRGFVFWEHDGRPVSMAGYSGPTPNGIRIGAVYTPPDLRENGYASACVSALSEQMLRQGRRYVFLFTDLRNPVANHIYQVIGYHPVCDMDEFAFEMAFARLSPN